MKRLISMVILAFGSPLLVHCHIKPLASTSYTVSPSSSHVTTSPSGAQTVQKNSAQAFSVTAVSGYAVSSTVGGTCPSGSWSGSIYTTGLITGDCTVVFSGNSSVPWSIINQHYDSSGNLYFAEDSGIVRKVTPAGIISTFAGIANRTQALSLSTSNVYSVVHDSLGYLYVLTNVQVYRVHPSTGVTTVIAGTGGDGYTGDGGPATSATFQFPHALAVDTSDNIYVADSWNHAIRKISATTGVISTIAGTGVAGYTGDGGPATSAKLRAPKGLAFDGSGNLYVADTDNYCIRKIIMGTGVISTAAGTCGVYGSSGDGGPATSALFLNPFSVYVDGSGDVLISDTNNHKVRKISIGSGNISTIAGIGTSGYSGDGGLAVNAELDFPRGLVADSSGNVYISDAHNNVVRKINASNSHISTFAGNGLGTNGGDGGLAALAGTPEPAGLAISSSGDFYIALDTGGKVRKVDGTTNIISTAVGLPTAFNGDGILATQAQISATAVAVDNEDNVYIADSDNNRVRKVDGATGLISTVIGTGVSGYTGDGGAATSAQIDYFYGMAVDSSKNIYITGSNVIRKLTHSTGLITTIAGTGSAGYLGDGGPATSAELNYPMGLALDTVGNLFIAEDSNHVIRKVNLTTGTITTVAGNGNAAYSGDGGPATSAELYSPSGVAVDASGNLYISDLGNNVIRKVSATTGNITTIAGTGTGSYTGDGGLASSATINSPVGIFFSPAEDLLFADFGNNVVRKIGIATGLISTIAGTGSAGYSGDGGAATSALLKGPR